MTPRFKWIIGITTVVIIGSGAIYHNIQAKNQAARPTIAVTRGTLQQFVTVTGKTQSSDRVDLGFERSGKVASINAPVGSSVKAGQLIMQLNAGEINAQVRQAEGSLASAIAQRNQYVAALDIQQAKLEQLTNGNREGVTTADLNAQQAAQSLQSSYDSIVTTLSDAQTKSDNAIVNTVGSLFSGSLGNYTATYNTCDLQSRTDAQALRSSAERALTEWSASNSALNSKTNAEREIALQTSFTYLTTIRQFLDRTKDSLMIACALNDSTLSPARANVSTAISAVVTAQTNISSLQQSIATQKITVAQLNNELSIKKSGSIDEQVAAQVAAVKQADASLASANAQIEVSSANVQLYKEQAAKFALRAPFSGVITNIVPKVGELVSPSGATVSLMAVDHMEIEAFIPEVDIGRISLNHAADITLDALPGEKFGGTIFYIDPA
ncbi:MAG: efflux RND transporter periplasmic adaptor subunit, partial [Candidatus Magasanikbacteria bacterium]|nr:efflux RND transporter periplasmic adaptor subunit [Candidatus Magasanikbacteria bacterium]